MLSASFDLLVTLYQAEDGRLWIPTMGGGLDVFDPEAGAVIERSSDPHVLAFETGLDLGDVDVAAGDVVAD